MIVSIILAAVVIAITADLILIKRKADRAKLRRDTEFNHKRAERLARETNHPAGRARR